ncbi:PucR family transcriptional regulator ligand-binding domain-containing protein [Conexibacter sp. DBS9H8]|uniref:PucR family transcriptional regulator n=1 Tax=Conexibacter sp. DBS9H8 TaxID=2937801 RepID=UPI00200FDCF2|nr:PucR family transcriptional regulator ligand-binding domain-containing protein [Conexibacter sp. DBS9H8]
MLTVRELLSDLNVSVLAGHAGLDRPIRWVHISELADPTPWLAGGEVLLVNGLIPLTTAAQQTAYINLLADHQIAALGFATGFGYAEVPEAMVAAAADRDLPLFEVAYDVPFIAITEAAFSRLVNEQYALLRRALAAQERLERIVLSQRGLGAVAAALATLLEARILVFDRRGEALAEHGYRAPADADVIATVTAELRARIRRRDGGPFRPGLEDPSRALALAVAGDGAGQAPPEAWLVAIKDAAALSDFDRLVLRQAMTIVGLELLRSRVADDTERRLAGDVLSAVLAAELPTAELARRLAPFGLASSLAVLVSTADLGGALRAEGERGLVARHDNLVCALVPGREDDDLIRLAEQVAARVDGVVGVGRTVEVERTRRAFHEARCALESVTLGLDPNGHPTTARSGTGPSGTTATLTAPRVATYRDLGSYQLLLSLQEDAALALFCDSVLGAIERSDGHYGGELIRSLEAFIEENGQWERAAKRLYCHRHTLRYRIKRVEELTGRDLSLARDRIEFWLALRGRELVN